MSIDWQRLRLEGVYRQNEQDDLMLRVKIPAGVLSAAQARAIADLADRFARGAVHLTTRGSIELHWLRHDNLPEALRELAAVGLTTRGACGGAVRGVACSTTLGERFSAAQVLARAIHRHFAGNPHFEGLPKKFKVGVDAGYGRSRHLIQDAGLILAGTDSSGPLWDVWLAGGLGREPQPAFLYAERLPQGAILPLIEAVVRLYRRHAPAGKRLKHVLRDMGEATFRRLLEAERSQGPAELPLSDAVEKHLTVSPWAAAVTAPVFAGELSAADLRCLAQIAERFSRGFLALTADQDVAFHLADGADEAAAAAALKEAGFGRKTPEQAVTFRICPGSHECRMGLAPTRDVARQAIAAMGEAPRGRIWAITGCPNSCAQPQLADFGIVAVKNVPGADGVRRPLFDLYRRDGEGFGRKIAEQLDLEGLLAAIGHL